MIVNNVLLKLKNPDKDVSEVQSRLLSMKGKIDVLLGSAVTAKMARTQFCGMRPA